LAAATTYVTPLRGDRAGGGDGGPWATVLCRLGGRPAVVVRTGPGPATAAALRTAAAEAVDPVEREHVMPYLYRHPERFRLANHRTDALLGRERWTVDTADDLAFVREVVATVGGGAVGWREVLAACGRRAVAAPGEMVLRPALAGDAEVLLAWRNDPAAVRFSGTGRAIAPAEHRRWLAERLDSPATRIWIGEVDGHGIGRVRLDVTAGLGRISLAVAPTERGRGRATAILHLLLSELRDDVQVVALEARVHPANRASLQAFARAGFRDTGCRDGLRMLSWASRAVPLHSGRSVPTGSTARREAG
jgi:RimJ/RimL family protein N-acetyltransferase